MKVILNNRGALLWSTRKTAKRVSKTIVPVTIYNVVVQHHDFTLTEITQNIVDSTAIELITQAMGPLHSDIHTTLEQMKEYAGKVYHSKTTRQMEL